MAVQLYVRSAQALPEPAVTEELLNKGIGDAALQAVRSVVSHQLISATVLNINAETVILSAVQAWHRSSDKVQVPADARAMVLGCWDILLVICLLSGPITDLMLVKDKHRRDPS